MKLKLDTLALFAGAALALAAGCAECKCHCCAPEKAVTMEDLEEKWKAEGPQEVPDIDWSKMINTNCDWRSIEWILAHPYEPFTGDFRP